MRSSDSGSSSSSVATTANFPVPRMPKPKCTLATQDNQTLFQPSSMLNLTLTVAGVAAGALVPTTTQQLVNGSIHGDYTGYKLVDLSNKATSIRNMGKAVYSWSVPTPRPLVAVDGDVNVPFTIAAYLQPVDDTDPVDTMCTLDIEITAPATCKLFIDKGSVPAGS